MIKKLFGLVMLSVVVASCGNSGTKATADAKAAENEVVTVEFASLIENPAQYENKIITITGKVVHVCTMSGKKMFIVGENPDIRLFISAGEEMPKFPMELLGSEITVTGEFAMVEVGENMGEGKNHEAEMAETEGTEELAEAAKDAEECETETALANQPALADYVLHYKSHEVK